MKKIFTLTFITVCYSTFLFAQAPSLWGTTGWGGAQNWGTIVKADSTGTNFQTVYDFDNTNGAYPVGNLCLANNGKLYGVTYLGGFGDSCVCFEYDTATDTYTKFYDLFQDMTQGWDAWSGMTKSSDGYLYGLCAAGGLNNAGVIYRIDPTTDTYNAIYHLVDTTGSYPLGSLVELNNGKLYGMTTSGGALNRGAIFSYDASSNTYAKLYDMDSASGYSPMYGKLCAASNGLLYGLSAYGGAFNKGVLFSFDITTNTYSDLFDFDSINGMNPMSSVIQADNGRLYGNTYMGGSNNFGTLFSYDINNGSFNKLYDFDSTSGYMPRRAVTQTSNGMLYGTTNAGGAGGCGTSYCYNIVTSTFTKLFDFGGTAGCNPDCEITETGARTTPHTTDFVPAIHSSELALYPSPAAKFLTINGNSISLNDIVTVTDVTGREVLQQQAAQSQHVNLNVASLPAGVYFVAVKTQGVTLTKKFVKS